MVGKPLLRLHGYAVSNYFNAAHAALLEKGARFEVVTTRSAKDEAFLAHSPMGKITYLEKPDGCLAETVAILEYLEDAIDGPAIYPADPFASARARQLINEIGRAHVRNTVTNAHRVCNTLPEKKKHTTQEIARRE